MGDVFAVYVSLVCSRSRIKQATAHGVMGLRSCMSVKADTTDFDRDELESTRTSRLGVTHEKSHIT